MREKVEDLSIDKAWYWNRYDLGLFKENI